MKELLKLFSAFFRIGLFTFGGGYAMLPMLRREIVEKHGWATEEELLNYFAIGQCTPGIIAVNTATFVGCKKRGIIGAAFSTLGMLAPSIIIITAIAALLQNFAEYTVVQHAFSGIRAAVCALIIASVIKMAKTGIKNWLHIIVAVVAFIIVAVFGFSPVWVVIGSALFGIFFMKEKEGDAK